jgi:hypothetical protein
MKFRTWAVAATAGAIGYVFGTAAGRSKFEELKSKAQEVAANPTVQQNISNLANNVSKSADKINNPVGGVIKSAANKVETSLGQKSTPSGANTPGAAPFSDAAFPDATFPETSSLPDETSPTGFPPPATSP